MKTVRILIVVALMLLPVAAAADASNVQLVGHSPLFNRGMNAAIAIYDHYVYVGNRTDASSTCVGATGEPQGTGCTHPHPGIIILDVKDPSNPTVVGEIGPPHAGLVGITTRELRVWPDKQLLIVMNFRCNLHLHACTNGTDAQFPYNISFFSLADPANPTFISSYVPTSHAGRAVKPHEMFLWTDPKSAGRALLYLSTPTTSTDPAIPNLIVADISQVAAGGSVHEIAEGNWNNRFPGTDRVDYPIDPATKKCGPYDCNLFVHSMGVTPDGKRTFLAMEAGQFLVLNTASVADETQPNSVQSLNGDLITDPANRPTWGQNPPSPTAVPMHCPNTCSDGHSAIKVPGRALALTTDEVYGTYTGPVQGCPWGWERLIDISDAAHPRILGEYKIAQDQAAFCDTLSPTAPTELYTSYSSHNPTVVRDLAIVAWHSGGLQISDISDPAHPAQAGFYVPTPVGTVATEDPALTRGESKVAMWSYPIIKDGLIYVVDVRNGLYILRYTGPHADEINTVKFLEGNSNLGDATRLDAGQ
jgi:hypothetical protein